MNDKGIVLHGLADEDARWFDQAHEFLLQCPEFVARFNQLEEYTVHYCATGSFTEVVNDLSERYAQLNGEAVADTPEPLDAKIWVAPHGEGLAIKYVSIALPHLDADREVTRRYFHEVGHLFLKNDDFHARHASKNAEALRILMDEGGVEIEGYTIRLGGGKTDADQQLEVLCECFAASALIDYETWLTSNGA